MKKRWRATAGKGKRAVFVNAVRMRRVEFPIRVKSPPPPAPEEEPQGAAAGKYENRGYMSVSIGEGVYYALFDPGAMCSVAGPALGERFANRLEPSIKFRVVDAVDQPMILGMDFGRAFGIKTKWNPRQWRRAVGRWQEFVTGRGDGKEATIGGKCAGLSSISVEQRSEVDQLVDEALASQKDQPE